MAASPLTCLKDHPRKGEKLTLSPNGTLAAITDSLGRILLLDTQALVVVRLWKVCDRICYLLCLKVTMLIFFDLCFSFRDIVMHTAYLWRCLSIKIQQLHVLLIMVPQRVIIAFV